MSVYKAVLIELFAIVWILFIGFMPQRWHGALAFGVFLGLVGIVYGFYADVRKQSTKSG